MKKNIITSLLFGLMFSVIFLFVGCTATGIKFRVEHGQIQWQQKGSNTWHKFLTNDDVEDIVNQQCTITYDFNLGKAFTENGYIGTTNYTVNELNQLMLSIFNKPNFNRTTANVSNNRINLSYKQTSNKGKYFNLYDFEDIGLNDYFLGWYAGNDKVSNVDIVADNITLKAKWSQDLSTLICTTKADYVLSSGEITAYPVEHYDYPQNEFGLTSFDLNELSVYQGRFYTIKKCYNCSKNSDISYFTTKIVQAIKIPKTLDSKCFRNLFNNHNEIITTYDSCESLGKKYFYFDEYILYHEFAQNSAGERTDKEDGVVQYLYYDYGLKGSPTLEKINSSHRYTVDKDNLFYIDKIICKTSNGDYITAQVVHISSIEPHFIYANIEYSKKINFNIIVGSEVNYLPLITCGQYICMNNQFSPRIHLDANLFTLRTSGSEEYEESAKESKVNTLNIYYYSETQPTDTQHQYWHYASDNKTPVVWEVN